VEKVEERIQNWEKVMDLFDNVVEQCSNCLMKQGGSSTLSPQQLGYLVAKWKEVRGPGHIGAEV